MVTKINRMSVINAAVTSPGSVPLYPTLTGLELLMRGTERWTDEGHKLIHLIGNVNQALQTCPSILNSDGYVSAPEQRDVTSHVCHCTAALALEEGNTQTALYYFR